MPKAIDSYELPDDIIAKMKEKLEHTKRARKEFGFSLCTENIKIHDEFHCIGTSCKIAPTRKCQRGKYVGDFHTHPRVASEMSIGDMYFAYRDGVGCVGGSKDNKIKCFTRKGEMNPKNLKTILYEIPKAEGARGVSEKRFREYEYVRENLQRNLFNATEII